MLSLIQNWGGGSHLCWIGSGGVGFSVENEKSGQLIEAVVYLPDSFENVDLLILIWDAISKLPDFIKHYDHVEGDHPTVLCWAWSLWGVEHKIYDVLTGSNLDFVNVQTPTGGMPDGFGYRAFKK